MKNVALVIALLIPAIICMTSAGWLAFQGMHGWGWFLFVGACCSQVSVKNA